MILKHFALLLPASLLTACATQYVAPQGTPTASLTIRTQAEHQANQWMYRLDGKMDEHRCSAVPPQAIGILNNKSIISRYADNGEFTDTVSIDIPANGSRFRIIIPTPLPSPDYDPGNSEWTAPFCEAHGDFVPVAGQSYEAIHSLSATECSLAIFRLRDGTLMAESTYRIRPFCYDKTFVPSMFEDSAVELYRENPGLFED